MISLKANRAILANPPEFKGSLFLQLSDVALG